VIGGLPVPVVDFRPNRKKRKKKRVSVPEV